ncbi:hypothetical protein [Massilia horti]|uniref:Uncharacterized protein n=1 Tax=Massilia horti TaxID=2562153 RepID=A0A4Y9T4Y6_9BURK|nr:hypothetical protein [Massilia horti]TFW34905.1 hypothetical protein E4O92_02800 [Massilia horti]
MRYALAIAAAALCAGTAFADEPAACYIAKDPTGDFVSSKVQPAEADPGTGGQIKKLMRQYYRETNKCIRKHMEREGGWPNGAAIEYGLRISPEGKLTQVSVVEVKNNNDAMLMACIGRTICEWQLEAKADGQERLVKVPVSMAELVWHHETFKQ